MDGTDAPAAEPIRSARDSTVATRVRNRWIIAAAVILALLFAFNASVWAPVSSALSKDDRNKVASLHAYRSWLVHPRDITLNLVTVGDAATIDLTRELFQTAEALKGRRYGKVTLSRGGKAVFVMKGEDFAELGEEFAGGQNPIYLVRTLPEKLALPDGRPAFGTWEGGWLGVLGRQLDDVNRFGQAWATGTSPSPSSEY